MEKTDLAILVIEIVQLSKSDDFETARLEWRLIGVELKLTWDSCLCGQRIKELCHIKNDTTGNFAYVGNVCINNFIGIDTGTLFDGLRRIFKDDTANPSTDLINHAHQLGYIFDNEKKFLLSLVGKHKISARQKAWKQKINKRILNKSVVNKEKNNDN